MIYVEKFPNEVYRIYFVRAVVSPTFVSCFDNDKPELLRKVETIPGIEEVSGHKYSVMVTIARSFSWGEIETRLLPLLHEFNAGQAGEEDENVVWGPEPEPPCRDERMY